jgi:hypothetical protein
MERIPGRVYFGSCHFWLLFSCRFDCIVDPSLGPLRIEIQRILVYRNLARFLRKHNEMQSLGLRPGLFYDSNTSSNAGIGYEFFFSID